VPNLNPFAKLPNAKAVWAWGMYDLANQSFQLLINSLLFSIYVAKVIADNPKAGSDLWTMMAATAQLVVVVLSPIAGAIADTRAWKRGFLLGTGLVCSVATACLALLGHGDTALAFGIFLVAAVACGLGENFLASFLPEISTRENVGFVSALGWTMSYIGALVLLGCVALFAFVFGRDQPSEARPMFVFAGVWFALGMLPAFFLLREKAVPNRGAATGIAGAFRQLADTARQTRRFRQLIRFLIIFFIYSMGTYAMIYFLGQIGDQRGFKLPQLVLFAFVIALSAGAAAAFTARVQDRLGHRPTISIFLAMWALATCATGVSTFVDAPPWAFWVVAVLIGIGLGGIGTSSRALVGAFTPEGRAAEFFGLWGLATKLSSVAGIVIFGQLAGRASPDLKTGQGIACFVLAGLFALGLVLMQTVDVADGMRAATNGEGTQAQRHKGTK
jgi:UMF1 family MFS transporter